MCVYCVCVCILSVYINSVCVCVCGCTHCTYWLCTNMSATTVKMTHLWTGSCVCILWVCGCAHCTCWLCSKMSHLSATNCQDGPSLDRQLCVYIVSVCGCVCVRVHSLSHVFLFQEQFVGTMRAVEDCLMMQNHHDKARP